MFNGFSIEEDAQLKMDEDELRVFLQEIFDEPGNLSKFLAMEETFNLLITSKIGNLTCFGMDNLNLPNHIRVAKASSNRVIIERLFPDMIAN